MIHSKHIRAERTESRVDHRTVGTVRIVVRRSDCDDAEEIPAKLLDISPHGMKLLVTEPFLFEQRIDIHLKSDNAETQLWVPAEVRWIRPVDNQKDWTIGCCLKEDIPVRMIHELVAQEEIDRRKFPRREILGHGIVQWELDPVSRKVKLLNLSRGGICFVGEPAGKPGCRLRLTLYSGDTEIAVLPAIARWQMEYENASVTGCEFLGQPGRDALDEIVFLLSSENQSKHEKKG